MPVSYNFSYAPQSINEGAFGSFQVTTTDITDGTTVYWRIDHGSTTSTDFVSTSGSFVINSNVGYFNVSPAADMATEGPKIFTVILSATEGGNATATSNSITINDTSTAPLIPGIATRLTSQGVLFVNGIFDEVTTNRNSIAPGTVYTAELDEITIHPMADGLAKRETHDGKLLVSGEFDEVTLPGTA